MEFHNTGSFLKRRSYPNLRHISLAPLTPRFPIDDDIDQSDYFTYHGDEPNSVGNRTPTRSSYLSSVSVPSTPPILSHSRSTSRTRHHTRSKSSTRATPASDTNLLNHHVSFPLHHAGPKKRSSAATTTHSSKSDAEWMLRAGIALASSTREEKGQSWLSKRESSTNLVSEMPIEDNNGPHHRHHQRTRSGASSRKSRSGASTPAWSRANSRRGSRAGLAMTALPPLSSSSAAAERVPSPSTTGAMSPEVRGRSSGSGTGLVPDFVDEKIRAEMASLEERHREGLGNDGDWDEEGSEPEYDYFSDETQEEFDEADLQRLTRERGFGLGGWIDRLVEWTLFGVDELPAVPPLAGNRIGATDTTTTVTFEEPQVSHGDQNERHDSLSLHSEGDQHSLSDDADSLSVTDGESVVSLEKPGTQGGWEDASWLFRVVKRALV